MGGRGGRARPGPREAEAQARAQGSRPGRPRGPPRPGPVLGTPPLWLPSWRSPVKQGGRKAAARSPRQGRRAGAQAAASPQKQDLRAEDQAVLLLLGRPVAGQLLGLRWHTQDVRAGWAGCGAWGGLTAPAPITSTHWSRAHVGAPTQGLALLPGQGLGASSVPTGAPCPPTTLGHFGPGYVFSSLGLSLPISQNKGVNRGSL